MRQNPIEKIIKVSNTLLSVVYIIAVFEPILIILFEDYSGNYGTSKSMVIISHIFQYAYLGLLPIVYLVLRVTSQNINRFVEIAFLIINIIMLFKVAELVQYMY